MFAGMSDGTDSREDMADRLRMLRDWAGYESNASAFARRSDLRHDELNHFESGRRPLSMLAANRLRLHWRVTLDWLFHGDRSGLTLEVANSLPHLAAWRARKAGTADHGRQDNPPPAG